MRTTATPTAIASSIGSPKPSARLGTASTVGRPAPRRAADRRPCRAPSRGQPAGRPRPSPAGRPRPAGLQAYGGSHQHAKPLRGSIVPITSTYRSGRSAGFSPTSLVTPLGTTWTRNFHPHLLAELIGHGPRRHHQRPSLPGGLEMTLRCHATPRPSSAFQMVHSTTCTVTTAPAAGRAASGVHVRIDFGGSPRFHNATQRVAAPRRPVRVRSRAGHGPAVRRGLGQRPEQLRRVPASASQRGRVGFLGCRTSSARARCACRCSTAVGAGEGRRGGG